MRHRRRSRCIYVAGAFSNHREDRVRWNIAKALFWALVLVLIFRRRVIVPHAAVRPDASWDEAMQECKYLLATCDEAFLVPGWTQSRGAVTERCWAKALDMPTYTIFGRLRP